MFSALLLWMEVSNVRYIVSDMNCTMARNKLPGHMHVNDGNSVDTVYALLLSPHFKLRVIIQCGRQIACHSVT